jgi:hypothetical protein
MGFFSEEEYAEIKATGILCEMLVEEYGFNAFDLQTWFNWKSVDTPAFYARTKEKELEAKLGIEKAPKTSIVTCTLNQRFYPHINYLYS